VNGAVPPCDQARQLIESLGFDGAQAEAEQAVLRASYFHLDDIEEYWTAVAEQVVRLRGLQN
jgi:hypothetical protein